MSRPWWLIFALALLAPTVATAGVVSCHGPVVWAFIGVAFAIDLVAAGIWAADRKEQT